MAQTDDSGVASEMQTWTDELSDASPDYTSFSQSLKAFESETNYFVKDHCSKFESSLYVVSFLFIWHAWLLHASGKSWEDEAEQGIQLLTKCASTYFGERAGAQCSNWQAKAIAWKYALENPAPP